MATAKEGVFAAGDVANGPTSVVHAIRSAKQAVREARINGIRAGLIKLETVWPFPEEMIRDIATRVQALIMPEINAGQMVLELERCAGGNCPVQLVSHLGGSIIHPRTILDAIENSVKKKKGNLVKKKR